MVAGFYHYASGKIELDMQKPWWWFFEWTELQKYWACFRGPVCLGEGTDQQWLWSTYVLCSFLCALELLLFQRGKVSSLFHFPFWKSINVVVLEIHTHLNFECASWWPNWLYLMESTGKSTPKFGFEILAAAVLQSVAKSSQPRVRSEEGLNLWFRVEAVYTLSVPLIGCCNIQYYSFNLFVHSENFLHNVGVIIYMTYCAISSRELLLIHAESAQAWLDGR